MQVVPINGTVKDDPFYNSITRHAFTVARQKVVLEGSSIWHMNNLWYYFLQPKKNQHAQTMPEYEKHQLVLDKYPYSFPPTASAIFSMLKDLGRSIGRPRALSQINWAKGPRPLDTPKVAV